MLGREPGTGQPEARRDDWVEEYEEQLPHRPRRRLMTPFNLSLLGVLLVAGGFIGGVFVEKGQIELDDERHVRRRRTRTPRRARPARAPAGGAAAGSRAAFGNGGASAPTTTSGTVSATIAARCT